MTFRNSSGLWKTRYIGCADDNGTNVCSSETIQPLHYPYIQSLELSTILILSPEKPSRALKSFADENSIKLVENVTFVLTREVHLGLQGWKPDHAWSAMAEGLIKDSIRVILNPKTHPILVTSTFLLLSF